MFMLLDVACNSHIRTLHIPVCRLYSWITIVCLCAWCGWFFMLLSSFPLLCLPKTIHIIINPLILYIFEHSEWCPVSFLPMFNQFVCFLTARLPRTFLSLQCTYIWSVMNLLSSHQIFLHLVESCCQALQVNYSFSFFFFFFYQFQINIFLCFFISRTRIL